MSHELGFDLAGFYRCLGLSEEYREATSGKELPVRNGFWTIGLIPELTHNHIVEASGKGLITGRRDGKDVALKYVFHNCSDDLDDCVSSSERGPKEKGFYAVSFSPVAEAAEVEKERSSFEQLKKRKVRIATLLECMVLGCLHFRRTGITLDQKSVILCSSQNDSGFFATIGSDPPNTIHIAFDAKDRTSNNVLCYRRVMGHYQPTVKAPLQSSH